MEGSNKKCENCGTLIIRKYGSGRFCSEHCAKSYSSKIKREQINKLVSKTLKEKWKKGLIKLSDKQKKLLDDENNALRAMSRKNHENHLARHVKARNGDILDITYGELEEYEKTHQVCEICGKVERVITSPTGKVSKLAIDHDHKTKRFRGFLCLQCNRTLGWYENNKEAIEKYLNPSSYNG